MEDTLNYQPAKYKKSVYTNVDITTTDDGSSNIVSTVLTQAKLCKPSNVLYSLNSLNDILNDSILTLSQQIISTLDNTSLDSYSSFLKSNDFNDPFLQSNITSINGNMSVEILYCLKKLQEEVINLKNVFKKVNYSDNIKDEDTIQIDDTTLSYLLSIENTDSEKTINYPIIVSDCQTNSLLLGYTDVMKEYCSSLNTLPTTTIATLKYNTDVKSIVSTMFTTSVQNDNYSLSKLNNCDANYVNNLLCSVYLNRHDLINALPYSYDGAYVDNPNQIYDDNLSETCSNIVSNNSKRIVDLSKSIIYSANIKQKYLDSATKKNTIRNNYLNSYSTEVI